MAAGITTSNRATMENHLFLLKFKACAGQGVTLFKRLDWKTPCLIHILANQLRLSQKDTWAFYASGLRLGTVKSRHCRMSKLHSITVSSRWELTSVVGGGVVYLTLTDPLRIQSWSHDRRNQTRSNRESEISREIRQKRTDKKVASKGHRRDKIENTNKNTRTVETN